MANAKNLLLAVVVLMPAGNALADPVPRRSYAPPIAPSLAYPSPYPQSAYSPGYGGPNYPAPNYLPPIPSPYGRDDDDNDYSLGLPPPGLDPRAMPPKPQVDGSSQMQRVPPVVPAR